MHLYITTCIYDHLYITCISWFYQFFYICFKKVFDLSHDIILCTVDVVGLDSNIPQEEGLSALRKRLDLRQEKYVATSTLTEQKRGTTIGTKFAPLYSILFMAKLEEEVFSEIELKP